MSWEKWCRHMLCGRDLNPFGYGCARSLNPIRCGTGMASNSRSNTSEYSCFMSKIADLCLNWYHFTRNFAIQTGAREFLSNALRSQKFWSPREPSSLSFGQACHLPHRTSHELEESRSLRTCFSVQEEHQRLPRSWRWNIG